MGSSKNEKELMDTDNSVVAVGRVEVEEGIREINGNGKNTIFFVYNFVYNFPRANSKKHLRHTSCL